MFIEKIKILIEDKELLELAESYHDVETASTFWRSKNSKVKLEESVAVAREAYFARVRTLYGDLLRPCDDSKMFRMNLTWQQSPRGHRLFVYHIILKLVDRVVDKEEDAGL